MQLDDHNPRKQFEESVQYAARNARSCVRMLQEQGFALNGLRFLELGPGADFAPQLVLASHGVAVTLVDKYLARWDPDYHPFFYKAFLDSWEGESGAIAAALDQGGYRGILREEALAAEDLAPIPDQSIDVVYSNAVLEHIEDLGRVARELFRVTAAGGMHSHQIDFRDHRDFERPLEHLLMTEPDYAAFRLADRGVHGTALRIPDFVEGFAPGFWIDEVAVNLRADPGYVSDVRSRLPPGSRLEHWSDTQLSVLGARLWMTRKATGTVFPKAA